MSEKTLPLPKTDAEQAIGVDDRGELRYRTAAESGFIEIELPSLRGSPNPTERLHAKDFGPHVASRIEASMNRQGYLKTGPQQSAPQTFAHYVAVAKGANLLEPGALKRGETLAKEFVAESEPGEFYKQVVRPWLLDLSPEKR